MRSPYYVEVSSPVCLSARSQSLAFSGHCRRPDRSCGRRPFSRAGASLGDGLPLWDSRDGTVSRLIWGTTLTRASEVTCITSPHRPDYPLRPRAHPRPARRKPRRFRARSCICLPNGCVFMLRFETVGRESFGGLMQIDSRGSSRSPAACGGRISPIACLGSPGFAGREERCCSAGFIKGRRHGRPLSRRINYCRDQRTGAGHQAWSAMADSLPLFEA
jgi:hypothetical protein